MPGIVGLITKLPRERAESELLRMVQSLKHESFYVTGTFVDESLGVYAAWVLRKGSFSDGMPLMNERLDRVLLFSGEEFPEPGIRNQLRQRGHTLEATAPAYLVHLSEEDKSFPAGLNGRFQGLLVDRTQGVVTLFNDRYGMERVYYHEAEEAFYFAPEAKAILEVRPELRKLNSRGLGEFLSCGCVLENRTLFEGLSLLPPASAWTFRNSAIERRANYFDPSDWENQSQLDAESYYREFREVFSKNLSRYFSGPERIGMSLTGGLDGRMIMAWQKPQPGSLTCYTFGDGGDLRQCRDVVVAQQVANACKQEHEIIPVGREFLSKFAHYAERTVYLTDGTVDLTHSPDLYLNERARLIAPVRMTGNYGSEVLRRAVAFDAYEPSAGVFRPELTPHVQDAIQTYNRIAQGNPISFAVFRQAPWHHYPLLGLENTQLALRSPYLDNELVKTVFRAPEQSLLGNDTCMRLIADGDMGLRQIPTDRGLNGTSPSLTSAAKRGILEFLFKAEYHYDSGMPQWVARIDHALSPLKLERLFLGWHKFHHFRIWYRDSLADYVRDTLLDRRSLTRDYVQPERVKEIVEGHLKGGLNYTFAIHKLLTLELTHRLFVDSR